MTGENFRGTTVDTRAAAGEITGNSMALERRDKNGIQKNRKNENEDRDKDCGRERLLEA